MGSRVRIAAAACLVASGLLAGGASASMALADPVSSDDAGDKHTNDSVGNGSVEGQKSDPDEKKTPPGADGKGAQSGTDSVHHPKAGSGNKDGDRRPRRQRTHGDNGHGGERPRRQRHRTATTATDGDSGARRRQRPRRQRPRRQRPRRQRPRRQRQQRQPAGATTRTTCSPGWPWWPVPVGQPPGPGGGGGGGGGHPEVPSGHPRIPPRMQLPPELMPPATEPVGPSVIDVAPGVGVAAAEFPIPPITLPVIVAPATGLGGGGGSPGSPALPAVPRGVTAKPPAGREPLPANVGSNVAVPASSYRIGYTDYLRYAGLSQVAALAVPGVAGMLVLTGAGGLVGYRQAKAGHAVHTSGTARFVN